ncbi:MAG: hypothetical protein RI894_1423 [Bacteroidota bacterium]|jgi:hypothetical protein
MQIRRYFAILSVAFILGNSTPAISQCAMCKMPAESNLANGGTDGSGLNKGILYMFVTPYLLVGTIAFLWWRGRRKFQVEQESEASELQNDI